LPMTRARIGKLRKMLIEARKRKLLEGWRGGGDVPQVLRNRSRINPILSDRAYRGRSFERIPPPCDLVSAEVDEGAHARGIAHIGMGDQPKVRV
jgi:hypothetical protein